MSFVIPIFVGSGEGGRGSLNFRGVGVVKQREFPDLRSPEVGISVIDDRGNPQMQGKRRIQL